MSNYRITSAEFITPGESGDPDAILSPEDLQLVKRQSGLSDFLQAQIEQRKQNKIEPIDVTIIREQKYDVKKS